MTAENLLLLRRIITFYSVLFRRDPIEFPERSVKVFQTFISHEESDICNA